MTTRLQSCILCGNRQFETIQIQNGPDKYLSLINISPTSVERAWIRCAKCSFTFQLTVLDESELERLYESFRDSSFREESADQYFDRITNLPREESENFLRCEWLHDRLNQDLSMTRQVADIGCGGGVFLKTFSDYFGNGWKLYGVEPTNDFAELAERRIQAQIIPGFLAENSFAHQSFDLVTCCQVLEHVADPISFVNIMKHFMNKSGVLYIETPSINDFGHLDIDHDRFSMQHISYFSMENLIEIGASCGLQVVSSEVVHTLRNRFNNCILFSNKDNLAK